MIPTIIKRVLKYLASLSERAVIYIFPLFLLLIEVFFRFAFETDTQSFIGPTLASFGIGLVLPLTIYSKPHNLTLNNLPPSLIQKLTSGEITIITAREKIFVNICWIMIICFTALWMWSLVLATKYSNLLWLSLPAHYYPGLINYLLGFVFSEVKELIS